MKGQGACIFLSFALFVVWMERQGRWTLFFGALGGKYAIPGSLNPAPVSVKDATGVNPTTPAPTQTPAPKP